MNTKYMKERKKREIFVWFAGNIGLENIHNFYNATFYLYLRNNGMMSLNGVTWSLKIHIAYPECDEFKWSNVVSEDSRS